ncbi:MAG: hypothetical protein ACRDI0_06895 [Actinomycetota bacterium]
MGAPAASSATAWLWVAVPLAGYAATTVLLAVSGRPIPGVPGGRHPLSRISRSLEGVSGLPGWAAGAVGTGLLGLVMAATGLYWDVGWHIDLGRDESLFTPAHTLIVLGLGFIALAGAVAVTLATVAGAPAPLRWRRLRVPWSALPLLLLGMGAMAGFPLDELWHRFYGVDVTLWGPTHLLMVGGGALAPIALWLVLAEAAVDPRSGRVPRLLHGTVAVATLTGLSAFQAEFDFGVPQFQLLYQPVLILGAAGVALTSARIVLGPGGALRAAVGFVILRGLVALAVGPALGHTVPRFPLYLGPTLAVEGAALLVGTKRPLRFAAGAAAGIATVGLAGEWAWAQAWARHPWPVALLPEAALVGSLAALGGAVAGSGLGMAVSGGGSVVRRRALVGAALALAVAMALPLPRTAAPVQATLDVQRRGQGAQVAVRLDPPDAARDARWFEILSWQGGGRVQTRLLPTGAGRHEAEHPVPVGGTWKTIIRLHRGTEMMAVPVAMPADREIGARAIRPVDRTATFASDRRILLRESRGGPAWAAMVIFPLLGAVVAAWVATLVLGAGRVARAHTADGRASSTASPRPRARAGPRSGRAPRGPRG